MFRKLAVILAVVGALVFGISQPMAAVEAASVSAVRPPPRPSPTPTPSPRPVEHPSYTWGPLSDEKAQAALSQLYSDPNVIKSSIKHWRDYTGGTASGIYIQFETRS